MTIKFRVHYSGNVRTEGQDILDFILALSDKFVLHRIEREGEIYKFEVTPKREMEKSEIEIEIERLRGDSMEIRFE